MFPVTLHVYDLSQGMAKQMSQQLIGKYVEGVWHTGIVIYGKEFYFGGGISYDAPAQTPFGKFYALQPTTAKNITFRLNQISARFQAHQRKYFSWEALKFQRKCLWKCSETSPQGSPRPLMMYSSTTATTSLMKWQCWCLVRVFQKRL